MVDYRLGFILFTVPVALVSTALSIVISADRHRLVLGVGLLVLGIHFVTSVKHKEQSEPVKTAVEDRRCIETRTGDVICHDRPVVWEGRLWSGIGAVFMGMVSIGLGEKHHLDMYCWKSDRH